MRSRTCPLFRPQGGGELCQPRNRTWRAVPHQVAFCNVMGSYLRIKPTRIGAAIKGIRTAGAPWHADRRFVGEIKYSFASGTEGSNPLSSAAESERAGDGGRRSSFRKRCPAPSAMAR